MTRLESKHWLLIGAFVVSLGTQMGGLDHWADLTRVGFVAGVVMQLGVLIGAIFAGAPVNPNLSPVNNPQRRETDPKPPAALGAVSEATRSKL